MLGSAPPAMAPSSRPSLDAFSRPPSSSRTQAPSSSQLVWHRYLFAGALLGALPSLAALFGSHPSSSQELIAPGVAWQSLMLSAIFSTALAALYLSSVGLLAWAVFSLSRRTRKQAQRLAASAGALAACMYLIARAIGECFRLSSGAALNLGTLEFLFEGLSHLLLPLVSEYFGLVLLAVAPALLTGWGAFRFLRRPPLDYVAPSALFLRGVSSVIMLGFLVQLLTTPGMAASGGLKRTADLALLSSIGVRYHESQELEEQAQGEARVASGSPLASGHLWEQTVKHLEGPRPNVIIVMLESVGLRHLGFEGYSRNVTPHLDLIAASSLRFRNARSTATHSNYAQMAILSSLFPRRYSGLDTYRRLDYPRVLWHDFLGQVGYTTATYSSQDETWQGMIRFQTTETPTSFHHSGNYDGQRIHMGSERIIPDEVTARRAVRFLEAQEAHVGLYVNFQSTHFPYKIPRSAARRFRPDTPKKGKFHYLNYPAQERSKVVNRYDNALSYVDAQVGKIYRSLEASGRLEDTLLIVTADHGELFGEHGMVTHGRSLYDAEARVPLLIHYPEAIQPGDVQRAVSTMDILPTIAELMELPAHPAFQGVSLLQDSSPGLRPVFMNIQGMKSWDAVVCGSMKFIHDRTSGQLALYDLVEDEHETDNLIETRSSLAQELHALLASQMRAQMAYHSVKKTKARQRVFAPRIGSCPTEVNGPVTAQLH